MTINNLEEIAYCTRCGSHDVEPIRKQKFLCGSCDYVFSFEEFKINYNISNKRIMLENGEMTLSDIVNGTIDYIFKKGVILGPNVENEIRTNIGIIPDDIILERLSHLEITTEEIME